MVVALIVLRLRKITSTQPQRDSRAFLRTSERRLWPFTHSRPLLRAKSESRFRPLRDQLSSPACRAGSQVFFAGFFTLTVSTTVVLGCFLAKSSVVNSPDLALRATFRVISFEALFFFMGSPASQRVARLTTTTPGSTAMCGVGQQSILVAILTRPWPQLRIGPRIRNVIHRGTCLIHHENRDGTLPGD